MSGPRKLHVAAELIDLRRVEVAERFLGYICVISALLVLRRSCGRWEAVEFYVGAQEMARGVEEGKLFHILGSFLTIERSCFAPVLPTLPSRPYFGN